MNLKTLLCLPALLLLAGCAQQAAVPEGAEVITAEYQTEEIPGTDVLRAYKLNEEGQILEDGFVRNNVKTGTWQTFRPGDRFPEKIISYENGQYNGPYMEVSGVGQIDLLAHYRNNKLHGAWSKFRFGRPEVTAGYQDGQLDGAYREFQINDGKLKKEINYRGGVQDGWMRYYNPEGEVTLQYEYKNGERVSGGMMTQPDVPNEPR